MDSMMNKKLDFGSESEDENLKEYGCSQNDENSDSSGERWDPQLLTEMDCVNVFIDSADAEDSLPELFDVKIVKQVKLKNCYQCQVEFGTINKRRLYCKMCGQSCCSMCSQNVRRLSKMDKKTYQICDRCDHQMSNIMFRDKLKYDIKTKQDLTQEVTDSIVDYTKKLEDIENQKKKYYQTWAESEKDMKQKQEILDCQVLQIENEKGDLQIQNDILDRQLKAQQDEIEKHKSEIQRNNGIIEELGQTKEKMQENIQELKDEVKKRNSKLMEYQITEEQKLEQIDAIDGKIDPVLMSNWIEDNNNSDTSEENGSDEDDNELQHQIQIAREKENRKIESSKKQEQE